MRGRDGGTATSVSAQERARLLALYDQQRVTHKRLEKVRQEVLDLLEDNDPAAILILVGPTGVGKSSLLESLRREWAGKCLYLETRSADGRAYDNRLHYRLLLEQLGDPDPDSHFDPGAAAARRRSGYRRPAVGRRATHSDLRLALERALPAAGIECILLDEAQHMFNAVSNPRLLQQMDLLKSLGNVSGVRHLLAGTPELLTLLDLSPQLHRRVRLIPFPAYSGDRKKEREQFFAAFRALVKRLPLPDQKNLSGEFEYVFENTAGCVGVLKDWLYRALRYALRRGLSSIDRKVLRKAVLPPGAVQAIADDEAMRNGLGNSVGIPPETDGTLPRKEGSRCRQRRIQRTPGIDPVGPPHEAA